MRYQLRAVGPDFVGSAQLRLAFSTALSAPPSRVYHALAEEPEGWPRWFGAVTSVTAERDGERRGRRVRLRGGGDFAETVLVERPDERYAYRVDTANAPGLRALAEDWHLSPAPDGGTRVWWTIGLDGGVVARALMRSAGPALRLSFRRAMRDLDRLLAREG
ncbi:SRPBCC family protein [Streptomyces sp. AJS327]|uniref:SRPBCC family protein n=1 Tax=Streptomyces sp. AJS327 TaxID=2545265 RepID=UPI0015DE252D|nr:SRPBCC family protein [Streptomyces sp. AJS327]MBA0052583.1 SRPBCC family protein [Streptomyces sp. AJS327]